MSLLIFLIIYTTVAYGFACAANEDKDLTKEIKGMIKYEEKTYNEFVDGAF